MFLIPCFPFPDGLTTLATMWSKEEAQDGWIVRRTVIPYSRWIESLANILRPLVCQLVNSQTNDYFTYNGLKRELLVGSFNVEIIQNIL